MGLLGFKNVSSWFQEYIFLTVATRLCTSAEPSNTAAISSTIIIRNHEYYNHSDKIYEKRNVNGIFFVLLHLKQNTRLMESRFLTNYTETTFLSTIQMNLRRCKAFDFSVSFIKKAGLVLLSKDIKAAIERGAEGRIFQCVRKIKC